jgi:hypothetical protein
MKRQRSYKLNGKYTYVEVPTNRERFYTWVALIGTIGFTYGNMVSPKLWSVMEARASEPVAVEQVLSVPTESLDTSEGVVSSYDAGQSPAPSEVSTEKQQIIDYIVEVFGEHAPEAFNVLFCENRNLDPKAINYNRNGTVDRGIFQLNSAYWGGEENFNYKTNIDKAYVVFERAGKKFTPWTCSHRINQKNYLGS